MSDASPVCFGAITFHAAGSTRCEACDFKGDCSIKVQEHIVEVGRIIDVDALMKKHRALSRPSTVAAIPRDSGRLKNKAPRVEQNMVVGTASIEAADDGAALAEVRVEAKKILSAVLSVGTFAELRDALRAGQNPFPASMEKEHAVAELLLRGQATKELIERAIEKHTNQPAVIAKALTVGFVGSKIAQAGDAGSMTLEVANV